MRGGGHDDPLSFLSLLKERIMLDKFKALLRSRRFWVAVGGLVVATTNILGFDLNPEQVNNIVLLGGAWIVGDSLRTA